MATAPLAIVKLAWLPAVARSHYELLQEPAVQGTEAYQLDRERRLSRGAAALALYALSAASLAWLVRAAAGSAPSLLGIGGWLLTAATGVAVARFESARLGPTTDPAYVLMVFHVPLGVATCAAAAALATAALWRTGARRTRAER